MRSGTIKDVFLLVILIKRSFPLVPRVAAGLVVGLGPAASFAQEGEGGRPPIAAFHDSLENAKDADALRAIEIALIEQVRKDRRNPALHVRLGLIAIRLGDMSGAATEFKSAAQADSTLGEAWFGLGLAELGLGEMADTTKIGRYAFLAKDALTRGSQAFTRAVLTGPGYSEKALVSLADRLAQGHGPSARAIRDGLRMASFARPTAADILLHLGRAERMLGDTTAAIGVFGAMTAIPAGKGLGLYELAKTHLSQRDGSGVRHYLEAAASSDSQTVALIRADLAWILSPAELATFDRVSGGERSQFVWRLWATRDRGELRQNGERLIEHYRRLAIGLKQYPDRSDPRLAVLIRQGEPDNRASLKNPGVPANESWRYRRFEGDLVVHFRADRETSLYQVVESIFDLIDNRTPGGASGERDGAEIQDAMLRSRAQLSPFYQAAVASKGDQLTAFRARERELGSAGKSAALTTDRFPLRYTRDLPARVQMAWFGRSGNRRGVDALFSIPAFAVSPAGDSTADYHPIRVRLVAWDQQDTANINALDTITVGTVVARPTGGGVVLGSAFLALRPGVYAVRVGLEVEGGVAGVIFGRDDLVVGDGNRFGVSDIALIGSRTGTSVAWKLDDGLKMPDPAATFYRSDTIQVFAGVTGVGNRGPVRVKARYAMQRTDGKNAKWKDFPGMSDRRSIVADSDGVARVRFALPLKKFKPGTYQIELEIEEKGGAILYRRASFTLLDQKLK